MGAGNFVIPPVTEGQHFVEVVTPSDTPVSEAGLEGARVLEPVGRG